MTTPCVNCNGTGKVYFLTYPNWWPASCYRCWGAGVNRFPSPAKQKS